MRSAVREELMKSFERELQTRCPQFKFSDSDRDLRIWSWKISPTLVFFVAVQAFKSSDKFAVEVAWSESGEFPWGGMGRLELDQSEARNRLVLLWPGAREEPVWDPAPEIAASISENMK